MKLPRFKGKGKAAGGDLPPPPDHSATRAADPYAWQAGHRRMAWLLRISMMGNVALGVAVVGQAETIAALLPLKEIRPALLRVDSADDRIYRVEPISQKVAGFDLLMETMARRYVRLILPIDSVTQTDRFQEAFGMTETAFYKRFRKERIESGEVQKAIDSGLTRSIIVESAEKISLRGDVLRYAVDFVQIDERGGKEIERKKLRAYLALTTRPHEVREAEKFENPLGVRVLDMSIQPRSNS